ncbi:Hypothetical protein Y17_3588 [Pectobacterium wasabiae CFBP 3304]|nr:Hypothetical protein Y17_3588 [Pectobacterium wasabiae CFBP 3304]
MRDFSEKIEGADIVCAFLAFIPAMLQVTCTLVAFKYSVCRGPQPTGPTRRLVQIANFLS